MTKLLRKIKPLKKLLKNFYEFQWQNFYKKKKATDTTRASHGIELTFLNIWPVFTGDKVKISTNTGDKDCDFSKNSGVNCD